uniref:Uncharacterized protein n=1 Tax=Eutreptiella gymnastica TaxID=73025 RepID=A0A7S1HT79_9EUGL
MTDILRITAVVPEASLHTLHVEYRYQPSVEMRVIWQSGFVCKASQVTHNPIHAQQQQQQLLHSRLCAAAGARTNPGGRRPLQARATFTDTADQNQHAWCVVQCRGAFPRGTTTEAVQVTSD